MPKKRLIEDLIISVLEKKVGILKYNVFKVVMYLFKTECFLMLSLLLKTRCSFVEDSEIA